jgi:hypothetical protein
MEKWLAMTLFTLKLYPSSNYNKKQSLFTHLNTKQNMAAENIAKDFQDQKNGTVASFFD